MPAPSIYRSTDTNAPVLHGGVGSLVALLDACLVAGYGSVRASGTITQSGQPSDADTVTIGSQVYTFKTSLTPTAGEVFIGATAAITLANLVSAVNNLGVAGTNYAATTPAPGNAYISANTGTVLTVTAFAGGTGGNSIALTESATNYTVSGAGTLASGSGSNTTASAGWTKPYSGLNKADFRPASGSRLYLQVEDNALTMAGVASAGLGRDASIGGFETMSAYNTGTGQWPAVATVVCCRKSSSLDLTARAWLLAADGATFYLWTRSEDSAGSYHSMMFGDIYSLLAGDDYHCAIIGDGAAHNAGAKTVSIAGQMNTPIASATTQAQHYIARAYTQVNTVTGFSKCGDNHAQSTIALNLAGIMQFPNGPDGGLYVSPIHVYEAAAGTTTLSTTAVPRRGRLRGVYQVNHTIGNFADGDTFPGSGDYAGRTFVIVKPCNGISGNTAMWALETTAWDTSS